MQKLAEICVRRPVFATMLILSLVVVGVFSFSTLGVDLFPKIDLPTITVTVVNPGAGPQEIETEITDKVEAAVNTISGIDELRSTSVEGVSQVFITFLLDKNVRRGRAGGARQGRPHHRATCPRRPKTRSSRSSTPTPRPCCASPSRPASPCAKSPTSPTRRSRSASSRINGVGNVEIIGGATREIHVWVDPDKMRAYNITVPRGGRRPCARRTWRCPAGAWTRARAS